MFLSCVFSYLHVCVRVHAHIVNVCVHIICISVHCFFVLTCTYVSLLIRCGRPSRRSVSPSTSRVCLTSCTIHAWLQTCSFQKTKTRPVCINTYMFARAQYTYAHTQTNTNKHTNKLHCTHRLAHSKR